VLQRLALVVDGTADIPYHLEAALARLSPRERFVIEKHLCGTHTFQDLGCMLSMSKEGVRQIEHKAIYHLRCWIREAEALEQVDSLALRPIDTPGRKRRVGP